MGKFDIVEAATSGYRYFWKERQAILQLAMMPLLVKIGSLAVILLLGLERNVWRQGLILLPSYFMEGLVVVIVIRMAMFGEKYTHLLNGGASNKGAISESLRRIVVAGVLIYVLTKLTSYMLMGGMMQAKAIEESGALPEPSGSPYMASFLILVFMAWSFRFFWLYVPAAMGMTVQSFLTLIKSFWSSFYVIALWMFCTVPLTVLMAGVIKMLLVFFPTGVKGSIVFIALVTPLQAAQELSIALICGLAMAYAIRSMIKGDYKPKSLF